MVSLPAFFLRSTSRNESRGAAARPEWRREHGVHRYTYILPYNIYTGEHACRNGHFDPADQDEQGHYA